VDDDLMLAFGAELIRISGRRATTYPGSVLDNSAFRILWMLVEAGPRTLGELAVDLQLEQSTINRQVNAAIQHGLVERYAVEGRTSRSLRPTPGGEEAYRHDRGLRAAVYAEVLIELGAARAHELVQRMREFNDALDRAHARTRD